MAQKFQLAIGNQFEIPVHLNVRDGSDTKPFKFHVTCNRLDAEQARKALTGEGDAAGLTVQEFLQTNLLGWRGQRLVLNDDGTPADFSVEALDALLSISGASAVLYQGYITALAAANGAEGQRKN
jgi:hypothetical protein